MKSSASLLTPILRSNTQGLLLAALMANSKQELSLTELARRSKVAVPTILRDIDRLVAGDVVKDRRVGRSRLVKINTSYPLYKPLWQIVMYGYGPAAVLPEMLAQVSGIEAAFIYGSWAARYAGELGEDPADIDVLVVGTPDGGELYRVARKASKIVEREVNINTVSPKCWSEGTDGFVRTVRESPLFELTLEQP